MAGQNNNSYKLLWMLGLALTLPMLLLAGPAAGYAIGYWLIRQFHAPAFSIPLSMGIGLIGSGIQTYGLIRRISNNQKTE